MRKYKGARDEAVRAPTTFLAQTIQQPMLGMTAAWPTTLVLSSNLRGPAKADGQQGSFPRYRVRGSTRTTGYSMLNIFGCDCLVVA